MSAQILYISSLLVEIRKYLLAYKLEEECPLVVEHKILSNVWHFFLKHIHYHFK